MDEDMLEIVRAWAARRGRRIIDEDLGAGIDGIVVLLESDVQPGLSVLKLHFEEEAYLRERDAYKYLKQRGWESVCGCSIPRLLDWDDGDLTLELGFVRPPYVLDFAQAFLRRRPDFPDDVWEFSYEKWREQFGDDWPRAQEILNAFESIRVYMLDPNPENFRFR